MTGTAMLAIETSQRRGSVALTIGSDAPIEEELLRDASHHEDDLMPAIDRLFQRMGVSQRELVCVAVSIGPGGFTGLRIAVSTAKMLAESLGVRLVAVPSAMVAAHSARLDEGRDGDELLVCLASKRETTWMTRLKRDAHGWWRIEGEAGIVNAATMQIGAAQHALADGYLPAEIRARLQHAGVRIDEPTFSACGCLAIARHMLEQGITTSSLLIEPIYAREPEAVRLWTERG